MKRGAPGEGWGWGVGVVVGRTTAIILILTLKKPKVKMILCPNTTVVYLEAEHQTVQLEEVFQVGLQGDWTHFYKAAPEEEEEASEATEPGGNAIFTIQTVYGHNSPLPSCCCTLQVKFLNKLADHLSR